jgi:hypothetical protein
MSKGTHRTLNLLNEIMSGMVVTEAMLQSLMDDRVAEDLYLDYKHGRELVDRKKGAATIREYMSAFANSAGGVLIIGIDEATWTITGAKAPGGGRLDRWAYSTLTDFAGYFSPVPRCLTVACTAGEVLLVATLRSPRLVPHIVENQLVHSLRFGDNTLLIPEYLFTDLTLGRRQHSVININEIVGFFRRQDATKHGGGMLFFWLKIQLENTSMVWNDGLRVGILTLGQPMGRELRKIGNSIQACIEITESSIFSAARLCHIWHGSSGIEPFEVRDIWFYEGDVEMVGIPFALNHQWVIPYTWLLGLYIATKDTEPMWYQVKIIVDGALLQLSSMNDTYAIPSTHIVVEPCSLDRPIVGWEDMTLRGRR